MRALSLSLLAVLLPLLAAALLLAAYLNYASVRTTYLSLVSDRLDASARRVAADAQTALSLGLPLAGQSALIRAAEREVAADAVVGRVDVVGQDGIILFSSAPSAVGEPTQAFTLLGFVEAPVVSPFGTLDGVVTASADGAFVAATLHDVFWRLASGAMAVVLICGTIIALSVIFVVRVLVGRLTRTQTTARGARLPQDAVTMVEAVDAAHRTIEEKLALRTSTLEGAADAKG
ncbi:MAG: hypothetical protein AAGF45_05100 [Pseudomonadota bacterium]